MATPIEQLAAKAREAHERHAKSVLAARQVADQVAADTGYGLPAPVAGDQVTGTPAGGAR
jgi:hypothetical protein